jgi:DNA ligase-1
MELERFAARASEIEAASADSEIVALVTDCFRDADDALPVVARFLQGRVFPAWDATKLDVGPSLCHAAIAQAAGPNVTTGDVEDRLADLGDIGAVAASYDFGGQRGLAAFGAGGDDALTVEGVYADLSDLAATSGSGSTDAKRDLLFGLFNRCSPDEARYLARLVLGEMRIGVGEGAVRDAIGAAFLGTPAAEADDPAAEDPSVDDEGADGPGQRSLAAFAEDTDDAADADGAERGEMDTDLADAEAAVTVPEEAAESLERALQVSNDYGRIAVLAREEGLEGVREVGLRVGRPVQAMLAQAGTVAEATETWDAVGVEVKYDGARVQIHHDPTGVPAPDAAVGGDDPGSDASADDPASEAEAGDDPTTRVYSRNMEPVTHALPEVVETVEGALDAPAILDGEVLAVDDDGAPLPFQAVLRRFRRKHDVEATREDVTLALRAFDCLHADGDDLLETPLVDRQDRLAGLLAADHVADLTVTDDPDEIAAVEETALADGHEGVMLKDPDSTYSPGRRGKHWLKRKPDVETLDCVVTGAEWGEGRRASVLGTFEVSVRTDDGYAQVGNVATGMTDEDLDAVTALLDPHVRAEDGQTVDVAPAVVFEVGYEEIQMSPTYASGYALRFPRLVGVRHDKAPADADTLDRVERLVEHQ